MEPDISLHSPPFLAGRASDFQGREQTVSHTQQACKYLLPNLSCSQGPYFHVELPFSCLDCCSLYLLGLHPSSTLLPESTSRQENSSTVFCSKSFSGSYWLGSFWRVRPPFENFRSTMDSHPMEKIKMYILLEAHPHPQDNTWTPQPILVLTTGLASTSFTSVCFWYLHALAILNYLQFLLYFLLFPAFVLCSCCSLCLECSPQFYAPDGSIILCTQLKHHLFSSLPKPFQADTGIHAFLTLS